MVDGPDCLGSTQGLSISNWILKELALYCCINTQNRKRKGLKGEREECATQQMLETEANHHTQKLPDLLNPPKVKNAHKKYLWCFYVLSKSLNILMFEMYP